MPLRAPAKMFARAKDQNDWSGGPTAPAASRRSAFLEPETWLVSLVVAQLALWTIVPWLFATSLPLDVVSDGIAWGHEWQWGYYKHPPLPPWTVELFFDAFGKFGPFLLSQIAVALTYAFVYLLGRELMPARWAAAGTLLLAGVYYFSIPTPEFNHNVAQMPFWAAASLAYYKAWRTGRNSWWFALGVAGGLGLLSKYPAALLLATMLAHLASTQDSRRAFATAGPCVAVGTALLIISPHLYWLSQHGFPTLHYAVARAGDTGGIAGRFVPALKFVSAQVLDIAPAVVAAAIAGLLTIEIVRFRRDENLRYLAWLTLGPPGLTIFLSLVTGLGIRDMWGAPMWNLTGLMLVQAAKSRWPRSHVPRLGICVAVLFTVGLTAYGMANVVVPRLENRPSRIQWPDRKIAQSFGAIWQQRFHRPTAIVAADGWLSGLVAMNLRPRPSVWIDGDFAKSPWITPKKIAEDGALVLWRIRSAAAPPADLARLPDFKIEGERSFSWPGMPKAAPLRIGYGFIAPEAASQ